MDSKQDPINLLKNSELEQQFDDILKQNKDLVYKSEDLLTLVNDAQISGYSDDTAVIVLQYLTNCGFPIDAIIKRLPGAMCWKKTCDNLNDSYSLKINWKDEYDKYNTAPFWSDKVSRNEIEQKHLGTAGFDLVYTAANMAVPFTAVGKAVPINPYDLIKAAKKFDDYLTFSNGGEQWSTTNFQDIIGKKLNDKSFNSEDASNAISLQSLSDVSEAYMQFYAETLGYTVYHEGLPSGNLTTEGKSIINEILLTIAAQKNTIRSSKNLSEEEKAKYEGKFKQYYALINSEGTYFLNNMLDKYSKDGYLDETERSDMYRYLKQIYTDMYYCLFDTSYEQIPKMLIDPRLNLLGLKDNFDKFKNDYFESINGLQGSEKFEQELIYAEKISNFAIAMFHDKFPELDNETARTLYEYQEYYKTLPDSIYKDGMCREFIRNRYTYDAYVFSDKNIQIQNDYDLFMNNIYNPLSRSITKDALKRYKNYYSSKKLDKPEWLTSLEKLIYYQQLMDIGLNYGSEMELTGIPIYDHPTFESSSKLSQTHLAPSPLQPTNILSAYKPPQYRESASNNTSHGYGYQEVSRFSHGGRTSEISIFGEAGPEWAIPERHDVRTAELLNSAREASGFSWNELIASTGGLNGGGNVISNNITYAPVVHANDASGVEEVLTKDKQLLDDWWKQKQWEINRTQWA